MPTVHQVVGITVLALASASPIPASATIFQFLWGGTRWSSGAIAHDASVVDSDPSPWRAVYRDAILDYSFSGLRAPFLTQGFEGRGGTLIVEDPSPDACGSNNPLDCPGRRFIFDFGRITDADPAEYRMVAQAEPQPSWTSELSTQAAWIAGLQGTVYNNLNDNQVFTMTYGFPTRHLPPIPGPVPEPATLALGAAGALFVFAGTRKRRASVSPGRTP